MDIGFQDLFVRIYVLMVGLTCGLGAVILTGGPTRFSGPSFEGSENLVGWMPLFPAFVWWGILFVLYGLSLVLVMGRGSAVHVLRFGAVVFWFLAIAMFASLFITPVAALTGIVAYGVFGLLFLVLADHLRTWGWRIVIQETP